MELKLIRSVLTDSATFGKLFVGDDFFAFTCEDVVRDLSGGCSAKVQNKTAIDYGRYQVIVNLSNHFNKRLALLLNVKCFEGIRIHGGNTELDSEGCILIGAEGDMKTRIGNCAGKVQELTTLLDGRQGQEDIFISIVHADES
jgi:hypothetical protein